MPIYRRCAMSVVTISRQFGSESSVIAHHVAELLGYSCLDRAILSEVSQRAHISEQEVERYDEKGPKPLERLFTKIFGTPSGTYITAGAGGYYTEMMMVPSAPDMIDTSWFPDGEEILSTTQEVIRGAARWGRTVIVGRGSQALLGNGPDTLHVRLVAPLEFRIGLIAKREGIGSDQALRLVQQVDLDRKRYIYEHYRVDWEDCGLYHMVINTKRTGMDGAAELIASAATRIDRK
jgi:CMP/dCMP kinase